MLNLKIATVLTCLICNSIGYKPVFLMHGILTGSDSMMTIANEIIKAHPGTIIYTSDRFTAWSSLDNAWFQVEQLGRDIEDISRDYPEGIHLLGYSQGGLLTRVILECFSNLNVKTFISLSSPQAGQYGSAFLQLIFPNLVDKTAYELFYSEVGQHTSVGNYWNDPQHQDLYFKYNKFLPFINTEVNHKNATMFRDNLMKLEKMILIGGPNDGVITPWESSHFGYFDTDGHVVPMHSRNIYQEDSIGLKALDKAGNLTVINIPHVMHLDWHRNKTVIRDAIIPYLD